ncbi:MAG: arginine decarboxylase, partial [Yoonia sp.]
MDSVSDYYSATQLRSDRWSALREVTGSLARNAPATISANDRAKAEAL